MSNPDQTRLPENDRIKELIPIHEIAAMMETGDYSAEMLLQHLCAHWNRRDGWLPIESAPRDGTRILVLSECGVHEGEFFNQTHWLSSRGWSSFFILHEPTHWRPLPEPPRENDKNQTPPPKA